MNALKGFSFTSFFGGFFADRWARISEGWRAWIVCLTTAVYLPSAVLCYLSADPIWAIVWFIGPAALGGVYIGTNFAILQSLAPVEMRAVMAAINLFILNIIGLGLGPVGVGFISDLAAPEYGVESIRYGLLATLIVMAWGALHEGRVGVLLHRNPSNAHDT